MFIFNQQWIPWPWVWQICLQGLSLQASDTRGGSHDYPSWVCESVLLALNVFTIIRSAFFQSCIEYFLWISRKAVIIFQYIAAEIKALCVVSYWSIISGSNWEGFKDNYSVLMFSHGDRCWNGPDRSLRVIFILLNLEILMTWLSLSLL